MDDGVTRPTLLEVLLVVIVLSLIAVAAVS